MTEKLYPPIVEPTIPPFFGDSITVPFTINRAVTEDKIKEMRLIIKSTITNEVIIKAKATIFSSEKVTFYLGDQVKETLYAGGFYKVQIAFGAGDEQEIGYYSAVTIAKYIGINAPSIDVKDNIGENDMFVGIYDPKEDPTEKLYSYSFTLYDYNNQIIDQSGELLHNSTGDMGLEQRDYWTPKVALNSGYNYRIIFTITTINGYIGEVSKEITAKKDDSGYVPQNIELLADMDEENGYVNITIHSTVDAITKTLIYGKFRIYRVSSKDDYKERTKVAYFSLENQDIFEKTFKDFTVESGYTYAYILQQVNDWGIHSEEIWSKYPVKVNYEHLYLFDGKRQLKIKYNPKVSSFKNTVYESKIDTLGGKYPFIFRNKNTLYKELNISGLISYKMDEQNLFLNDSDIWPEVKSGLSAKERWTHNLIYDNITAERAFKLKVLDWLNNGEIKLFKSPTEGNYIIRLLNVSLTPTDTLGRMLHTFTATGYEVDDANNYQFTQELIVDKINKYIGYKTNPLYDFPKARLLNKNNIVIDNSKYEIIITPNLEFVTGVRFEDIKPLTKFKVTLERKGRIIHYNFMIGATGFYAIPTELGYHIKQIRLVEPKWEIGDYGFDIINNRGQVTYEFERQAKHNNFNDITDITSDIVISAPMYSDTVIADIQEPLITIDGNSLYQYDIVASEEALVEIAYFGFDENNNPVSDDENEAYNYKLYLRDADYIIQQKDDGTKVYKDSNNINIELFPSKRRGYQFTNGQTVPVFENAINPTLTGTYEDGKLVDDRQKYTIRLNNSIFYFNPFGKEPISETSIKVSNITKTTPLYLPAYDSKGVRRIERTVTDEQGYCQNPFYVYCGTDKEIVNGAFKNPVYADIYKTVPVIEIDNDKTDLGQQTIYRNFVTNKYYDATNVDGEYYIKEEIQSVYNLNFELVQVFYEQKLNDTEYKGKVSYEPVESNNEYAYSIRKIEIENKGKFSYDETPNSNKPSKDSPIAAEIYYDFVSIYNSPERLNKDTYANSYIKSPYVLLSGLNKSEFQTKYQELYGLSENNFEHGETLENYIYRHREKFKFFKMEKTKTPGIYKYTKCDFNKNNDNDNYNELYINPCIKGYDNYIEATTPKENEVIIVYSDHPNHIERISLKDRLSYGISAEDFGQEDLRNIAAVYIGKNVRGFITYKRKLYSYQAVLDDGLVIELTPYEKIKQK